MRARVTALVLLLVWTPGMVSAAWTDAATAVQARPPAPAPVLPPPPPLVPERGPRRPLFPAQPIVPPGLRLPRGSRVQAYVVTPGRPPVVCGVTLVPALPDVDPKSLILVPRDGVRYTIREAPVPIPCP